MLPLRFHVRPAPSKCWLFSGSGLKLRAGTVHVKVHKHVLPSQTRGPPQLPSLSSQCSNTCDWRKAHEKKRFPIWESWKVDLSHLLNCCPCLGASSVAHWRLNLSINSCWLQIRPRTSLNIMFFEWFLCCAYWNSNYCGYHFKNIAPLTFFDRWKLGIFSKGL